MTNPRLKSEPEPASPESSTLKLLSIVITGRDDDYMLDFKYRITTTINYIARNLKRLERLDDVEILVTDWGSEVPLAHTLSLSPEAGRICRFVYVPPAVIRAVQNGGNGFHTTLAANAGLRRASGKFLMVSAADILIPQHSLEAVLKLLGGELHVPIDVDHTYFLLSRYHVPWQFVQRQPRLDDWDRYLLLHASQHEREEAAVFSISSAAGALMMHRSLWRELGGLDERLGGVGFNDIELGLRVTQRYPWVELSSIGISLFHMEHTCHGRRASITKQERNPRIYTPVFQVNDASWGLDSYEFETQMSQSIRVSGELAESLRSESQGGELWDQSRQEILAELTSKEVRDHVRRIIQLLLIRDKGGWNIIGSGDMDSLFFLSWYSQYHYPRRYLEFGVRQGHAAAVVAAACPSVEIYGVDRWEGALERHTPIDVAFLLKRVARQAYVHFINGHISTALQRLQHNFVGSFFFDLVLVRCDLLGTEVVKQVSDLLPHLAAGGALVLTCRSVQGFASEWEEIRKRFPQFTYLKCRNNGTGLVLAASLRDDKSKDTANEGCSFDTSWIWLSYVKCQSIRLYFALKSRFLRWLMAL